MDVSLRRNASLTSLNQAGGRYSVGAGRRRTSSTGSTKSGRSSTASSTRTSKSPEQKPRLASGSGSRVLVRQDTFVIDDLDEEEDEDGVAHPGEARDEFVADRTKTAPVKRVSFLNFY